MLEFKLNPSAKVFTPSHGHPPPRPSPPPSHKPSLHDFLQSWNLNSMTAKKGWDS